VITYSYINTSYLMDLHKAPGFAELERYYFVLERT